MVQSHKRKRPVIRAEQAKFTMYPRDDPSKAATVYAASYPEEQRTFAVAWNTGKFGRPEKGTVRFYIHPDMVQGRREF